MEELDARRLFFSFFGVTGRNLLIRFAGIHVKMNVLFTYQVPDGLAVDMNGYCEKSK
jgi:hypothetical protein